MPGTRPRGFLAYKSILDTGSITLPFCTDMSQHICQVAQSSRCQRFPVRVSMYSVMPWEVDIDLSPDMVFALLTASEIGYHGIKWL